MPRQAVNSSRLWARPAAAVTCACACLLLTACGRPWRLDDGNVLGDNALLRLQGMAQPTEHLPLERAQGFCRVLAGSGTGDDLRFSMQPLEGGWWLEFAQRQGALLIAGDDGSVAVRREDDFDEGVRVEYEPAIVILPAGLRAGEVRSGQVSMSVYWISTGQLRMRGACDYQVRVEGTQRVSAPAGDGEALVVRVSRRIALPLAKVEVETLTAYQPGLGAVAERIEQETRVLGLLSDRKVQEWRLARRAAW